MPLHTTYIKLNTIIQKEHNLTQANKIPPLTFIIQMDNTHIQLFLLWDVIFEYMNLKQQAQNFNINRGLQNYLCEAVLLGIHTSLLSLCSNHPGLPVTERCRC